MKKNLLFVAVLCFGVGSYLNAQPKLPQEVLKSDSTKEGIVKYLKFNTTYHQKKLKDALLLLQQVLQFSLDDELKLDVSIKDEQGNTHNRYSQYYKGLKVADADYVLHTKGDVIESVHGHFFKVGNPATTPKLSESIALAKALAFIKGKKYRWEIPEEERWLKAAKRDNTVTFSLKVN